VAEDDVYEIYAIRYGHHDRRSPANYIGGDPHDVLQPLDYYIWAIVGKQTTYVLDTGFDEAMGRKRERAITKPIGEGLKAIGIDPDAVEQVIVSHLHFDHTGNYDLFPRARYHLQDCEMAYATGRCMCHPHMRLPRPTMSRPWCARSSPAALNFTTAWTNSHPASASISSAAIRADFSACA
jgi:glyoxylase-like metal-dependent hydrolase (beta-lactamase superfamily II)